MATRLRPFPKGDVRRARLARDRIQREGSAVRVPHVRELIAGGNRAGLPDGMPEGIAKRSVRRLDLRILLRGQKPPVRLV